MRKSSLAGTRRWGWYAQGVLNTCDAPCVAVSCRSFLVAGLRVSVRRGESSASVGELAGRRLSEESSHRYYAALNDPFFQCQFCWWLCLCLFQAGAYAPFQIWGILFYLLLRVLKGFIHNKNCILFNYLSSTSQYKIRIFKLVLHVNVI